MPKAWTLKEPDVLMIPIGGRVIPNTMNEKEAVEAVKLLKPKIVIFIIITVLVCLLNLIIPQMLNGLKVK